MYPMESISTGSAHTALLDLLILVTSVLLVLLVLRRGWSSELLGDYDPETKHIRVWMSTAVRLLQAHLTERVAAVIGPSA